MKLNEKQRDIISKLFFDLIKMDFAVLILSPFLRPEVFSWVLVFSGVIIAVVFLILSLTFAKAGSKESILSPLS